LFYVALTRVENHLILVGAPKGSRMESDGSLNIKRPVTKMPSMGEMWLDALRVASHAAGDADSPWLHEDDDITQPLLHLSKWKEPLTIDPVQIHGTPHLGRAPLTHLDIIHDIDGLTALATRPSVRTEMREHIVRAEQASPAPQPVPMPTPRRLNLKMAAHKLDSSHACERRLWLSDVRGWSTEPILPRSDTGDESENGEAETTDAGLPDPASLGTLFHRLVEIGIANTQLEGKIPVGIDQMWTMSQTSALCDQKLISQVIGELMPADADPQLTSQRLFRLGQLQEEGRLGKLCAGGVLDNQKIVGLRTELPFHIAVSTDASELEFKVWAPGGTTTLADIGSAEAIFNGLIDLSIAIDEGDNRYLQVIDLKTEECSKGFSEDNPVSGNPLQQPVSSPESTVPQNQAERELLNSHRLQLALYSIVLEKSQEGLPDDIARGVLPPAIQACASGRMLTMTKEELMQAKLDLATLLDTTAQMHLNPDNEPRRLPADDCEACIKCPYY
ncbi:MAG: PD-(D/E)XK nuclease family protein, partial [Candidatus Poseidoniaceae archaeon]|nr:PD-(D/E)XK nuclease family protein [Candidatus Poseidoniaceae archaeon]